jgi:hypothetical protein
MPDSYDTNKIKLQTSRISVLTAVVIKISIFWDITSGNVSRDSAVGIATGYGLDD